MYVCTMHACTLRPISWDVQILEKQMVPSCLWSQEPSLVLITISCTDLFAILFVSVPLFPFLFCLFPFRVWVRDNPGHFTRCSVCLLFTVQEAGAEPKISTKHHLGAQEEADVSRGQCLFVSCVCVFVGVESHHRTHGTGPSITTEKQHKAPEMRRCLV